jgi:hypothetical protein
MTRAFYEKARKNTFPYDIGDDPAFFSASHLSGPVTWGVCRPDVRSAIGTGDWIVFFSNQRDLQYITHYRLVAALCVEEKLRHTSLFEPSGNQMYRDYLNLLIRPNGSGWEHFEPAMHPSEWHRCWSWRMCERHALRKQGLRKKEVVAAGKRHIGGEPITIDGHPLQIAENYVVFSTASAVLTSDPPLVATHRKGDTSERWETDARSNRIRRLVFGNASRGLRTSNPQQPHRHFRRRLDDPNWPDTLREVMAS